MEIDGKRILVAGATGVLGGALARELSGAGARLVLAGRDPERLAAAGREHDAPTVALELTDRASPGRCIQEAADAHGGLDGLVLATGNIAFGNAETADDEVSDAVFAVNVLGPVRLMRHALATFEPPGALVALSAVVVDYPTAGMAVYSAAKGALSAYLAAVRHERRRDKTVVLDVRPPHLDTGFEHRAMAGKPPRLPEPVPAADVVPAIIAALREERRTLAWDLEHQAFTAA